MHFFFLMGFKKKLSINPSLKCLMRFELTTKFVKIERNVGYSSVNSFKYNSYLILKPKTEKMISHKFSLLKLKKKELSVKSHYFFYGRLKFKFWRHLIFNRIITIYLVKWFLLFCYYSKNSQCRNFKCSTIT